MKFINLILFIMLVLIYSCTDQIINTVVEKEEFIQTNKVVLTSDSSIINSDKPLCGTKDVTVWLFDHYEPKAGKLLGIWPGSVSQSLWSECRTIWGFSQVIVGNSSSYSTAINAGYSSSNIFLQISNYSNYQSLINSIDAQYYIDEPFERGTFTTNQLVEISNYILSHRPGKKLYLGSYSTSWILTLYLSVINSTSNSYIMCDFYDDGFLDFDQRNEWSEFKDFYGSGNLSNWIHSERDGISEFDQLIGHANNIGINSLWLFIGSDGNAGNVDEFSYYAWKSGWLRRFDRKYVYEYRCSYPDPCDCDPTLSDGWYVYEI
ncbi:MAG: hypothetical protein IPH11_09100 [Ignavibacteriales bacterium]|nr:hypothetical protein [Ignavibacteriales bacterium]